MIRNAVVALVVCVGCSPIVDNKNMPDAAIDAPSTMAPKIVMSIPADKATGVSVLSKVTVFFDVPLDPTSVTNATVHLRSRYYAGGFVNVAGTVAYDDAGRKLTFSPYRPLYTQYQYALGINGVKDTAGNALMNAGISFLTYSNSIVKAVYINSSTFQVNYWYDYPLDANGHYTKNTYHSSPGTDGVWMTADDPLGSIPGSYTWSPEGRLLEQRYYGVGPDGLPNTPDDVVTNLYKYNYDAMGFATDQTSYNAAGPDMMWGTNDDVISGWTRFTYNARGNQTSAVGLTDAGADGVWKTADDRGYATNYSFYESRFDMNDNQVVQINKQFGADRIPFTADDVITAWYENVYDQNGYPTRYVSHPDAGTNGIWLDADDGISGWSKVVADPMGDHSYGYNGKGGDNMWFTADDACTGHSLQKLDANKLMIALQGFGAGPDTVPCTADDVVNYSFTNSYDSKGSKIDQRSNCNPGADGIWTTADDRCFYTAVFDLAH